MYYRKAVYLILTSLFFLDVIFGRIIFYGFNKGDTEISFLDVGQGDAIFIQQGKNQLLIDGGRNGKIFLEKLGEFIPFWDREIEAVIITHPDADHIGGLLEALDVYQIGTIIKTQAESDSQIFQALKKKIVEKNMEEIEGIEGVKIKFPLGGELEIIYPFESVRKMSDKDTNKNSIVAKFIYGESSFLFTGDISDKQEKDIINKNFFIASDFLKVSHHGSKNSTSENFLKVVAPRDAIISVGKNNSYGHPAPEILERLSKNKIKIFRTDEMGDIVYQCRKQKCGMFY